MACQALYTAYTTESMHTSMDTYGSPEAPVIQKFYFPPASSYPNALYVIKPFLGDTNDNVDDTMHMVTTYNLIPMDLEDKNIPQNPSSEFPDQNNPEKYINKTKKY